MQSHSNDPSVNVWPKTVEIDESVVYRLWKCPHVAVMLTTQLASNKIVATFQAVELCHFRTGHFLPNWSYSTACVIWFLAYYVKVRYHGNSVKMNDLATHACGSLFSSLDTSALNTWDWWSNLNFRSTWVLINSTMGRQVKEDYMNWLTTSKAVGLTYRPIHVCCMHII